MNQPHPGLKRYSLITLVVLWIAMIGLSSALGSTLRGTTPADFFPVAAVSVTISWFFASVSKKTGKAWTVILSAGILFVLYHNAKLQGPILILLKSIPVLDSQILRWLIDKTPINMTIQVEALNTLLARSSTLGQNLWLWLRIMFGGNLPTSLAARIMIWSSIVLMLSTWAGWILKKKGQVFLALCPSMLISAYILNYSGKPASALQIELFALLLLMGWVEVEKHIPSFRQSISKPGDPINTISTMLALSLFITFTAGLVPSVSIGRVAEDIRAYRREKENRTLAEGLGLLASPGSKAYASSGLPRQHLIGLDPSVSKNIVMVIETGEVPPLREERLHTPAPRHYWRSITYDVYTGQGWATTLEQSDRYAAGQRLIDLFPAGYQIIRQKVAKSPQLEERVYWTGTLLSVNQPIQVAWRVSPNTAAKTSVHFDNTDLMGALTTYKEYQAISLQQNVSVEQLRAARMNYSPWIRDHYLALPPTVPIRVLQLSRELTEDLASPYEKALAIQSYLRSNPYTLDVPAPPPGRDVADYFLFDLKKGYCDYYATAMVVLARASGLPARLVTGYASGVYYANEAKYLIRESDAHSWVEIYFAGIGWIEFEPTANRPLIDRPLLPSHSEPQVPQGFTSPDTFFETSSSFAFLRSKLTLPLAILLGFIGLGCVIFTYFKGNRSEDEIFRIYRQVYRLGRKLNSPKSLHETPSLFATRLEDFFVRILQNGDNRRFLMPAPKELALLTNLYIQALYSPHRLSPEEKRVANKTWRRFYWRLLLARFLLPSNSSY
jgi:transglutaminase-like putative cysteine protease